MASSFTPGAGGQSPDGWHPTVKYLLLLLIAEMAVVVALRSITKHGG